MDMPTRVERQLRRRKLLTLFVYLPALTVTKSHAFEYKENESMIQIMQRRIRKVWKHIALSFLSFFLFPFRYFVSTCPCTIWQWKTYMWMQRKPTLTKTMSLLSSTWTITAARSSSSIFAVCFILCFNGLKERHSYKHISTLKVVSALGIIRS